MTFNSRVLIAFALAGALLAACGGGGGSSNGGGGALPPGGGSTPVPNPSPTATATAPGTTGTSATGRVLDLDNGTPLAGATVVIGNTPIVAASAPATLPADDKSATTAADGTFTISGLNAGTRSYTCGGTGTGDGYCTGTTVSNAAFVHVFTSDHIALHGYAKIVAGTNAIGDLKVTKPTSADLTRLAKINQYRATVNAPAVVLDEALTEASRFYAAYVPPANAVEGTDPDQGVNGSNYSPNSRYHSRGGFLADQDYENLGSACPGNVTQAEDSFFAEGPSGGHYQNLMNPNFTLVGLGMGPYGGSTGCAGSDEDFTTTPQ